MGLNMFFFKKKDNENFEKLKEDFDALKVEYDKVLSENVAMRGRMDYVEELLADCEKLQEEWRNRVREAKETKIEMMNLISALSKTQFESE